MVIHRLLYITFSVVHLSISALLAAISVLLSSLEDISSILFELSSDFYGVPPRPSFPTEKCAILILGAQEGASVTPSTFQLHIHAYPLSGVGRNAALSFSELGYTVFALCPNRREGSGHLPPSERSRDVASVRSVQTTFLCLAAAYLTETETPLSLQSFYTFGTTGKRGHDRFPGV